jgi:hypothetical protein
MWRFLGSILSILSFFGAYAQTQPQPSVKNNANCTQVLRLARAVYEQGRLHELETLLKDCLAGEVGSSNGFATVQEKVDAYKLLTLSYIYLEEPEKANTAMLGLLRADHFFEVNKASDPAEFQALYKTFRSFPVLAFGGRIASNLNLTHLQSNYYVWSDAKGQAKYSPNFSIGLGLFAEKELFAKTSESNFLHWTTTRLEFFYHNRNFNIKNPKMETYKTDINLTDGAPTVGLTAVKSDEARTKTGWIDANAIMRYRFRPKGAWDPYVGIGPGFSYLLSAKITTAKLGREKMIDTDVGDNTRTVPSDSYSGPEIETGNQPTEVDVKDTFNPTVLSAIAILGVNRRAGAFYINAEIRYQYGFGNRINAENRSIPQLLDYGIIFNDYSFSNVQAVAGITFPYFKPKKLTKRK